MPLAIPLNNVSGLYLAQSHESGATTLVLNTGAGAAIQAALDELGIAGVTPETPIRITVVSAGAVNSFGQITNRSHLTVFLCEGRTGDTLTGCTPIEGTTDDGFSAGDRAGSFISAGALLDIHDELATKLGTGDSISSSQLPGSGVAAGNYPLPVSLVIDAKGRATAAASDANLTWDSTSKRQAVTGTIAGRATGTTINLSATITNVSLTANVATFTTTAPHSFRVYDRVVASGLATTALNSSFIVSGVPSSTTFTCRCVHADIASSPDSGTAVVSVKQAIQEIHDANGRRAFHVTGNGGIVIENDLNGAPARYGDNASITIAQTRNGALGDDAAFIIKDASFAWVETTDSPGLSYQFELLADGSLLTGRGITCSQDRSKPSGRISLIGPWPYMIGASADINGPCYVAMNQRNIPGEPYRLCFVALDAADLHPDTPAGGIWSDRGVGKHKFAIGEKGELYWSHFLNPDGPDSDPEATRLVKQWLSTTTNHATISGSGLSGSTTYLDLHGATNGNAVLQLGSRGVQNAVWIGSAASSSGIGQIGLGGSSVINMYNTAIGVAGIAAAIGVDDAGSVLTLDTAPSNIGVAVLTARGKNGQIGHLFRAQDYQQNNLFVITADGSTRVGASTAGSAAARFEAKAKDGSSNIAAFYTSGGTAGVVVNSAGALAIGGGTPITKVLSATATLDFGSVAAQSSADLTISLTGAVVGDSVSIGLPASPAANTTFAGWVSAADTVTVRFNNYSAAPVDPPSGTYRVTVTRF